MVLMGGAGRRSYTSEVAAERERWWTSPAWIGTIAGVASAIIAAVALFATNDSGARATRSCR